MKTRIAGLGIGLLAIAAPLVAVADFEAPPPPPPPLGPTCSLTASATSVFFTDAFTLSWSSVNAESATLNAENVGVSGTKTITPSALGTLSYTLVVTGTGGSATCTKTVSVSGYLYPPTVTFTGNGSDGPISVYQNDVVSLRWFAKNARSCALSANAPSTVVGSVGTNSSASVPVTQPITYTIRCEGNPGTSVTDSVVINMYSGPRPACLIKADKGLANLGQSYTLSWTSQNASSAVFRENRSPFAGYSVNVAVPINGVRTVSNSTQGTYTYSVEVTGQGGVASCFTSVDVQPITGSGLTYDERNTLARAVGYQGVLNNPAVNDPLTAGQFSQWLSVGTRAAEWNTLTKKLLDTSGWDAAEVYRVFPSLHPDYTTDCGVSKTERDAMAHAMGFSGMFGASGTGGVMVTPGEWGTWVYGTPERTASWVAQCPAL